MTDEEIDKIIRDTIGDTYVVGPDGLRSLVLAGMAAEREACAKVADEHSKKPKWWYRHGGKSDGVKFQQVTRENWAKVIAAAIRKRSIEPTTP